MTSETGPEGPARLVAALRMVWGRTAADVVRCTWVPGGPVGSPSRRDTIALSPLAPFRRTMMQVARSLAALALALVIAGCGTAGPAESPAGPASSVLEPAASTLAPAAAADPSDSPQVADMTAAEIEQLLAQVVSQPVDVSDPGPALDRAEQRTKDYMRRASGVADLLGPDGAAILAGIDTAEKELVAGMVADLRAEAATPGAGSLAMGVAWTPGDSISARLASVITPAPPPGTDRHPQAGGESLFGAFMFMGLAPEFAKGPRNASGNLERETMTEEKTLADGTTLRLTLQPSLAGSKLSAMVKVEISVPGPPAYKEEVTGTLTADLCPDASGAVPLELSLGGGFSLGGGGMQYKVSVTATGHTDDSGRLASVDMRYDGSLAAQPWKGQNARSRPPMYLELRVGLSVGMAPGGGVTNVTGSLGRYSSRVDVDFAKEAGAMTGALGSLTTALALHSAQQLWTTGYCVAITVPEMDVSMRIDDPRGPAESMGGQIDVPSKRVVPGSEMPFTAVVTHKFEGGQLNTPVTATLKSGGVSVTPSGTKVPAPASFHYKAPEEPYVNAVVTLETRSRRGIATLFVAFRTVPEGWILTGPGGVVLGKMCGGPDGD